MRHTRNLFIFFKIFCHQAIYAGIKFDSLSLKMLNLLGKRRILALFKLLKTLLSLIQLAFNIFASLLLEVKFVLELSLAALLMLFKVLKLLLKIFKLEILLTAGFQDLCIDILLHVLHLPVSSLSFLGNPCFKLRLFHLVEILSLQHLLFSLVSCFFKITLQLLFLLCELTLLILSELGHCRLIFLTKAQL